MNLTPSLPTMNLNTFITDYEPEPVNTFITDYEPNTFITDYEPEPVNP